MCELASFPSGVFNWREVVRDVQKEVDIEFRAHGTGRNRTLKLFTTKEIRMPSGTNACKEVFVDYGIKQYWIPYILRNMETIGRNHWMVKRVLWFLLSRKSSQANTQWARGQVALHSIDMDIINEYSDADCPVPLALRRRR